jgi:hypothetical protein
MAPNDFRDIRSSAFTARHQDMPTRQEAARLNIATIAPD